MSARRGKLIALGLGAALVAGFLWSQRPHPPELAAASGQDARSVRVLEVREQPVALYVEAVGSLRSRDQVAIASRLTAQIRAVPVQAGSAVAAGELLVALESAELAAHVSAAEARLAVAEQTLDEAQREERRTRTLFEREARTRQELDAAATRLAAADAGRAAASGQLAAARAALDDALLRAPFDGVVLARHVDPGDLATPGRILLELYDPRALRLEAAFAQRLLAGVAVGDTLTVVLDAVDGPDGGPLELAGRVDEIVPAVDAATRTALVKIVLPEVAGVLPGMFARARVPDGERVALVVPREALVVRGQLELVFTASDDGRQAHMHLVRSGGAQADGGVELLAGLSGVQQLIVEGAQALRDGAPIRIERTAPKGR